MMSWVTLNHAADPLLACGVTVIKRLQTGKITMPVIWDTDLIAQIVPIVSTDPAHAPTNAKNPADDLSIHKGVLFPVGKCRTCANPSPHLRTIKIPCMRFWFFSAKNPFRLGMAKIASWADVVKCVGPITKHVKTIARANRA